MVLCRLSSVGLHNEAPPRPKRAAAVLALQSGGHKLWVQCVNPWLTGRVWGMAEAQLSVCSQRTSKGQPGNGYLGLPIPCEKCGVNCCKSIEQPHEMETRVRASVGQGKKERRKHRLSLQVENLAANWLASTHLTWASSVI